jgi:predicted Zn-dependent protease
MRSPLLTVLLAAALAAACTTVQNPVSGRPELTVMDEKSEIAEGQKSHKEVLSEYGAYDNSKLQAYVDDLGQRLARQSHRANLQWTFTVLDSPETNAFALPGGFVYVTRGIMAYMDSEADLAGVIGHEIGHVTARHGAQRATRQQAAGLGVFAATILGVLLETQGMSGAAQMAGEAAQGVAAGYIASYSREQELQADQLGAEYLARSSYDPKNMIDVIQVLKDQERMATEVARNEGRAPPQNSWLSSHPSNDQRLAEIRQIASRYSGNYSEDGRARYLQAINGMTFGESREQGVTRGQNFYHEPLGIALTAPSGWRIRNSREAIAAVSGAGNAALVVRLVPPRAGNTHDEIIRNVFKLEQGRVERRSLSGLQATHFVGTRRNEQGQTQNIEATIVTGPSNQNFLLSYAAKESAALQRARPQMQEAEASFRPINSAERAAARPWTLRTVAYQRGNLAQLARQSPLPEYPEQQLRLLNGLYGGGEPRPGQLIKVVE